MQLVRRVQRMQKRNVMCTGVYRMGGMRRLVGGGGGERLWWRRGMRHTYLKHGKVAYTATFLSPHLFH